MKIDDVVGDAARLASDHVHDREKARALLLRLLHRRERVDGLAGLRHRDDELALRDGRMSIAVLARDLDVAGDARDPLDQVFPDESRVRRRSARDKADARDRADERIAHLDVVVEDDAAARALDATQ